MISRRHLLYVALLGLVGFSIGAAWPPPPLPRASPNEGYWTAVPSNAILRHAPADMSRVASHMRWNTDNGVLPGSEASNWRLAGTLRDSEPAILIMAPGNSAKATRVAVGEKLPDGSLLHSVNGDIAATTKDGCTTSYQLFRTSPISFSEGCESPAVPDQGTSK